MISIGKCKGTLPAWVAWALALTMVPSGYVNAASPQSKVYDEAAEGARQIADALIEAKKEHKRVLLEIGANWCGPCRLLHAFFESEKSVNAVLKAGYVVVLIDNDHNQELSAKYFYDVDFGLPVIVILADDGLYLTTKNSDELVTGGDYNAEKTVAFLQAWAPQPRDALIRQLVKMYIDTYADTLADSTSSSLNRRFQPLLQIGTEVVPYLIEIMKIPSNGVDGKILARYGCAYMAIGKLLATSGDYNSEKTLAYVEAGLHKSRDELIRELIKIYIGQDQNSNGRFLQPVCALGEEAIPYLIESIKKLNPTYRAYYAIGKLHTIAKSAVPILAEQFNASSSMESAVADTLIQFGPDAREALSTVIAAFQGPDYSHLKIDDAAVRAYFSGSSDKLHPISNPLQIDAARILVHLDPDYPQLLPTLQAWLKSPNVLYRRFAANIIGVLGSAEAKSALTEALKDEDAWVRKNAARALKVMVDSGVSKPIAH